MPLFEGFTTGPFDVGEAQLYVRHGGNGLPVLLLHGHPRTGATWHRVAPQLVAAGYTVVVPDLRGYGRSSAPSASSDHAPYSKRANAGDLVRLMRLLGHERFAVAGHDRGSYVALRLTLDHPEAVERLAVLDSVPISEALARCGATFAQKWWHWFFYAQPDRPERAILADPDAWYGDSSEHMGEEAYAEYRSAIHDPATVRAMLEDYRAGLGIDRVHEEADRAAGRRVTCPLLVLWSSRDDMEDLYGDPRDVWRDWATDLRGGGPIESGHHMAEEAPDELAVALQMFLTDAGRPPSADPRHQGPSLS
jgi:haloacetate dehalogenase